MPPRTLNMAAAIVITLTALLLLALAALAIVDVWLILTDRTTVSEYLLAWSQRCLSVAVLFTAVLVLVAGVFIGHLFWPQPIVVYLERERNGEYAHSDD